MLFIPERHEPLCNAPWSDDAALDGVREIVRDIEAHRQPDGGWPTHALDDDGGESRDGYCSLYLGSAGVLHALGLLQRGGAAEHSIDLAAGLHAAHRGYRARPDTGEAVPSYFLGEVGILLALWQHTREPAVAGQLHAAVKANIGNPTNEALWAAPGTMVAALHLWRATGEARWRELFLQNVEQLWRTWLFDDKMGCHLWTQDLVGSVVQYYGAGHGTVGNLYPLLEGALLLDEAHRDELWRRTLLFLKLTARHEDVGVNWPPSSNTPRPGRPQVLMQWCHGAPGFLTALAAFPVGHSAEVDALLLGAGEAVWRAGPLAKGAGLCHGTAGNGYALLELHRRTGEARWLERARRFAMHALAQSRQMRQQHGRGRYTLWTGDPGVAVYLWHCIVVGRDPSARVGLPGLHVID